MSRNEIIRSGSTARNPSERGMAVPSAPSSHVGVVGRGREAIEADPTAAKARYFEQRIHGQGDPSQGNSLGADRKAR
jgi:hypothetical protein